MWDYDYIHFNLINEPSTPKYKDFCTYFRVLSINLPEDIVHALDPLLFLELLEELLQVVLARHVHEALTPTQPCRVKSRLNLQGLPIFLCGIYMISALKYA